MQIELQNTGKKFIHHWIFRHINLTLGNGKHYGVLGNNGSGKTTLLKIISGILSPSEGTIRWNHNQQDVSDKVASFIGWASPHLELIEEFTLDETLVFHRKFRSWLPGEDNDSLIRLSGLATSRHKPLKNYSSGMKQRVKLLLAVMSENPLIILDEPCSNLDARSVEWYQNLISTYASDRIVIIGSNDKETECNSCHDFIDVTDYQKKAVRVV